MLAVFALAMVTLKSVGSDLQEAAAFLRRAADDQAGSWTAPSIAGWSKLGLAMLFVHRGQGGDEVLVTTVLRREGGAEHHSRNWDEVFTLLPTGQAKPPDTDNSGRVLHRWPKEAR